MLTRKNTSELGASQTSQGLFPALSAEVLESRVVAVF